MRNNSEILKNTTAVIPVAGLGMRLKPHTHTAPKVLLPVAGKPILGYILDEIKNLGIEKIVLIIGHLGEMIMEYISEHYDFKEIKYVEQQEFKGLGQAIYLTKDFVGGPILIILGDTVIEANFKSFFEKPGSWIGLKKVADPRRFGVAVVENGFVKDLIEKPDTPPSNLAVVGAYFFENSQPLFVALAEIIQRQQTTKGEYQLTDGLKEMVRKGEKIRAVEIEGWFDCGKPETLLETNRYLLNKYQQKPAREYPDCVINQPVYFGRNVSLKNSVIGPYTSVGDDVSIENAVIQNSILHNGAVVRDIVLSSSIIGHSAAITGKKYRVNIGDSSEINFKEYQEELTL
jgi:glucose-1-phosphate thymidylyltransferase